MLFWVSISKLYLLIHNQRVRAKRSPHKCNKHKISQMSNFTTESLQRLWFVNAANYIYVYSPYRLVISAEAECRKNTHSLRWE